MPRLQRKSFNEPETVREFPHGSVVSVSLDETVLGRFRFEPGWRWSKDVAPIVGTHSCQNRHVGVCLEGSLHVELEDGTTTFFVRPMGEQLVSVLGEVPLATAQQFGRSVAHR